MSDYRIEAATKEEWAARALRAEAKLETLEDAARSALEYVEHKESEWGVNLVMGNKLRAALASLQGEKNE